ncbi:hypothetical protein [Arcanobacterium urinimassiliense]|uniref:hypothetical protein n=1 Tax=Arcanobacterium urinimassiliense TaxID=1871014 RepID=UPI00093F5D18|nr:hypothetical protein [Arcanobacterium urinimassiliense]
MSHMARLKCVTCNGKVPEDICSADFDSRQSIDVIHYLTHYGYVLRDIALIQQYDPEYVIYPEASNFFIPSDVLMFIGRHYEHFLLLDSNYEEENKLFELRKQGEKSAYIEVQEQK